MKHHLFTLLLCTGVVGFISSIPRKYYLIQQGESWSNAQAYCRVVHDDLATIEDHGNMVRLQDEAQSKQFRSSAWIGLYNDITSWRWSLQNETLGSFRPWCQNEPDNWKAKESCGTSYNCWADSNCYNLLAFTCFDATRTGNARYITISILKTWYEAQSYCRTYHTDLASSRDPTDHFTLSVQTPYFAWIGLYRDLWKWSDQANFLTINWMSGEPNNHLGSESCVSFYAGQAADKPCTDVKSFFCQRVITGQIQIIRFKIQTTEDVNDPAVQTAVLEKIKQRLEKNGMSEKLTVKWRQQPGGVVFKQNRGV